MNEQVPAPTPGGASETGFNLEGKACPSGAGVEWWTKAWPLFTAQMGTWIGVALITLIITIVALAIPLLGQIAFNIFWPVIAGGLMLGAREVDRGGSLTINHIFVGFSNQMGQLVLVGVITLVGMFVAFIVAKLITGVSIVTLLAGLGTGHAALGAAGLLGFAFALLIFLALILPIYMAVWFAPALVVFHGLPAMDAIKASFSGCLKNVVPFLLYGLIGFVLFVIATIPIMLGWLVLLPLLTTSVYVSYRDIYLRA
jgi:uncharacterized membrane protein